MDSDSGAMRAGSLMQSEGMGADRSNDEFNAVKKQMRQLRRQTFRAEATARLRHSVGTTAPFLERLVLFWSNHFTVSIAKIQVRAIAGAYEREVIRPRILGNFTDLLNAAIKHPAMLIYLDNQGSFGPNSRAGRRRGKGLNENLAREVMELHTLGVNGGYAQQDVVNFARILTGWTVSNQRRFGNDGGRFHFARRRHEPGDWTILGKNYEDYGGRTGEDVLDDLASHPATARHIARKLAIHFVADAPPPALVQRLEHSFLDTGGDLRALAEILATAKEAWTTPPAKVIPPYDFVVALKRGFGVNLRPRKFHRLVKSLGQPLWRAPSPKGWPDGDLAWASPAAIRERLRVAEMIAGRALRDGTDPADLAIDLFGQDLSSETQLAVARAANSRQGLELLIMSREFQRR